MGNHGFYSLGEAQRIADDLLELPGFDLTDEWATETVQETLSRTDWDDGAARHFKACETRIRQVSSRFMQMDGLWDAVANAESSRHFRAAPAWAQEAVGEFLNHWESWEEGKEKLRVYGEGKLRHVRAALAYIHTTNEREDAAAKPGDFTTKRTHTKVGT